MTAEDQVRLAGRLNDALLAAGLEVVVHRQRSGQAYYPPAELVDVVGWLASRGWFLREMAPTPTSQAGPAPFTPLVVVKGEGR